MWQKANEMFWDEIPFWREHITHIRVNVSEEFGDLAAYYFWRRLLFYYVDMKRAKKQGSAYAKRLVGELRADKTEIARVYASGIVSKGRSCPNAAVSVLSFVVCGRL